MKPLLSVTVHHAISKVQAHSGLAIGTLERLGLDDPEQLADDVDPRSVKLPAASTVLAVGVVWVDDVEGSVGEEVIVDGGDGAAVAELMRDS